MNKTPAYNRSGAEPAPAKLKGRLKYKPMPQTARELADSTLYRVQYRVQFRNSSFIAHPRRGPEQEWRECILPRDLSQTRVMYAVNLPKDTAEQVIQYWNNRPAGDTFEFRLVKE